MLLALGTLIAQEKKSSFGKYIDFMTPDTIANNASLFTAAYNFGFTPMGNVSHGGRGSYLSLGVNLARFFSKKHVLSLFYEMKGWKGFWPVPFQETFINDFNAAYNNTLTVAEDLARAETVSKLLNGSPFYSIRVTFYAAYGIAISPIPYSHGGFLFNIKKGLLGIPVHGTYGSVFNKDGTDWVSLSYALNYRAELVCKPLTLISSVAKDHFAQAIQLSFFVQEIDWSKAAFDGLELKQFLNAPFFDKYNTELQFGLTMKFGFY